MTAAVIALLVAAAPVALVRWFRVAQREHYLAGEVTRFALRWWRCGLANQIMAVAGVAAAVASWALGWLAAVPIAIAAAGPLGLGIRGRTSRLVWTRRLRTVAAVTVALVLAALLAGTLAGAGAPVAAGVALAAPLFVDAALAVLAPVERRIARTYVRQATDRLDRVAPTRVAITGSYGKTTIKGFVRHLTESTRSVVASPASFNNTGGLSRTVNEMLAPDTEVFVAEMGTYGPGEIRDLCSWVAPDIAVLCNIGPVHLERFGSLDRVVTSKAEIFERASTAVLNIDAHGLADEAERQRERGLRVITCSTDPDGDADVRCWPLTPDDDGGSHPAGPTTHVLSIGGETSSVSLPDHAAPVNVACAVAVALALDVDRDTIEGLLATLPGADHRAQLSTSPTGVVVIDDTYNANPAGAAAALARLSGIDATRRAVVTPGMVELGPRQAPENEAFAAAAAAVVDDIVIVGRTNRPALARGAASGPARVHHAPTRDEAVAWVRANLGPGDAVLYENDLPDHHP